jgi:hypothetical protein
MSATVAHVPAPPPRRVTGNKIGDGPLGRINDHRANVKVWENHASYENMLAATLIADAATMRDRNHKTAARSRRDAEEQSKIVFGNLVKKVRLLKSIRHKLQSAEAKLRKATDGLLTAREHASQLAARLERPLQKCSVRSELRNKRPGVERVADDVAHAVQSHAEGITAFIQKLQAFIIGADQLSDENHRHLANLQADIVGKTASIQVEEECLALNSRLFTPSATQSTVEGGDASTDLSNSAVYTKNTTVDTLQHAGRNAQSGAIEWQQRTAVNLERAQQLLDQTTEATTRVTVYMAKIRSEHSSLNTTVATTLAKKTETTAKQEGKLSENLDKLEDELNSLQQQREALGTDIRRRQEPLFVAKRRLDARRSRPNAENVRDAVETELEKEFLMLAGSIEQLQQRQKQVDAESNRIRQLHSKLRMALLQKQCAMALDRECLELDDSSRYNLSSRGSARQGAGSQRSAEGSEQQQGSPRSARVPAVLGRPNVVSGASSSRSTQSQSSQRGDRSDRLPQISARSNVTDAL